MVGSGSRSQHVWVGHDYFFSLQRLWLVQTMKVEDLFVESQRLQYLEKAVWIRLIVSLKLLEKEYYKNVFDA